MENLNEHQNFILRRLYKLIMQKPIKVKPKAFLSNPMGRFIESSNYELK